MKYDYLIVGAGLFGASFARFVCDAGKRCLVIDRRKHIAGNIYTRKEHGINVHVYGAHIFHTSDKDVWDWIRNFADFNNYINAPIAVYHGKVYNLPFNMNTFAQMWGVVSPAQAKDIIKEQVAAASDGEAKNLEEQALKLVGRDIFETLVKEYTEKQWGRDCKDLPPFIIKRLPVRYTYDNNYFNDCYQGIPYGGYTAMIERMLEGIELKLDCEYKDLIAQVGPCAERVIYTGPIDEYFDYVYGALEYRSLHFESQYMKGVANWQGNAVVNYTSHEEKFTRIIEHKHFEFGLDEEGFPIPDTIITREYPLAWKPGDEPYYPVNDVKNTALYKKYVHAAAALDTIIFAGRLGSYTYYDMAPCIAKAHALAQSELAR